MDYEKLAELVITLNERVTKMEERMSRLEEVKDTEGVYLDGSPAYVRDFVNKESEGKK